MKTYGCELCGKRFLDSLRLRMHLLAHSGGLGIGGMGGMLSVPTQGCCSHLAHASRPEETHAELLYLPRAARCKLVLRSPVI